MCPEWSVAHITRLLGPGKTAFFEVDLEPPGRMPGQVSVERARVVIDERHDAPPEQILAKARQVLSFVATSEWDWDQPRADCLALLPC